MNAEQRKSEWDSLPQPKPSWESFKRLVGQFDSTKTALIHWDKRQRSKIKDAVQAIIEARDLCGNEREALQDWQHENGRLTAHQKQQGRMRSGEFKGGLRPPRTYPCTGHLGWHYGMPHFNPGVVRGWCPLAVVDLESNTTNP